ncbi:hypothetical protein D9758_005262 [Tetrapyrgos nigripes]|uniref:HAT C-terminal dimerisation domain-containing protein n=1 Tax=Tetrapyrgos nigripes TaxID=182062 RepID=A0A8H5GWZ1_9AGAR|nr:hypothetical protein D9758_005262 [Tetrapyrgos nigripes]
MPAFLRPSPSFFLQMSSEQCAVNADGSLKDANEIDFYHDPDDAAPIAGPSMTKAVRGQQTHNKHAKMLASVESDKYEADGITLSKPGPCVHRRQRLKKKKGEEYDTDIDDENYSDSGSASSTDYAVRDELTEFWKLPPEDSENCDPITWWAGHKAMYPNLYRLALDIFSMKGLWANANAWRERGHLHHL